MKDEQLARIEEIEAEAKAMTRQLKTQGRDLEAAWWGGKASAAATVLDILEPGRTKNIMRFTALKKAARRQAKHEVTFILRGIGRELRRLLRGK